MALLEKLCWLHNWSPQKARSHCLLVPKLSRLAAWPVAVVSLLVQQLAVRQWQQSFSCLHLHLIACSC